MHYQNEKAEASVEKYNMHNLINRKILITATFLIFAFSSVPNASGQWANVGLFGRTSYLVVSGSNLFANARANMPIQANEIFHSTDSGASWNQFGTPPDSVNFFGLLGNIDTILFGEDSRNENIFRSTDYGKTWSICSSVVGFMTFVTLGGNGTPVMIFASTFYDVYFSSDSGNSWIRARDSGLGDTNDYVTAFTMIGTTLYAGEAFSGVYASTDTGNTWTPRNTGLTIPTISAFAMNGSDLFAGTNLAPSLSGGIFLSTDSGNSWKSASNGLQPSISINALAVSGNDIFAAVWDGDSGVFKGVFMSSDNGINWSNISEGLADSSVGSLAVADGFLFAATDSGIWRRPLSDFNQSGVAEGNAANSSSIQVFPNPAPKELQIMGGQTGEVHLFDLMGRERMNATTDGNNATLDVSHLEPGMYFLRLGNQSTKVEIAH